MKKGKRKLKPNTILMIDEKGKEKTKTEYDSHDSHCHVTSGKCLRCIFLFACSTCSESG